MKAQLLMYTMLILIFQWDLVCKDSWLVQFTSTAYIAGMLVGSLVSGIISDK